MKKLLLLLLLFLVFLLLFIYPSFYTFPPVDCLAGCRGLKGLPFTYYEFHGSGVFIPEQKTASTDIDYKNLVLDLGVWFVMSSVIVNIGFAISRLVKKGQSSSLK